MAIINYKDFFSLLSENEKKHAPKELFWKGDFSLLTEGTKVAVVGSRSVSSNGIELTKFVSANLCKLGHVIVSGLAEGVDTVAHETAISKGGKTIAVLGTPLNQVFPKSNSALYEVISTNYLAITQFPIGAPVSKFNFPIRNKTMALISDATIIIEASENSGTRHQGWEAIRLGRTVFLHESLIKNASLTWPKKMLDYGAIVINENDLESAFENIPQLTLRNEFAL